MLTDAERDELAAIEARAVQLRAQRPHGIWCWGCGRRYVPPGHVRTPHADIVWEESLCYTSDCPANAIAGEKAKKTDA